MTVLLVIYLHGAMIAAALLGFNTKASEISANELPRLLMTSLGWPIIIAAGFGGACCMFNVRRLAEDEGRPWVDQ